MKLLRYGPPNAEKPGLLDRDGTIRCLASVVRDIDGFALSDAALRMIFPREDDAGKWNENGWG